MMILPERKNLDNSPPHAKSETVFYRDNRRFLDDWLSKSKPFRVQAGLKTGKFLLCSLILLPSGGGKFKLPKCPRAFPAI